MAYSEVLFEALFEYIIVFPNSTFLESSVWLGRGATFNSEKQVSEAEGPNPDLNYSSVTYSLQDLHLCGPLSLFTCQLRDLSHVFLSHSPFAPALYLFSALPSADLSEFRHRTLWYKAFQENRRKAQEVLCRIVPSLWGSSIQASLERAVPPPSPSSQLGIPFMSQADNNFPVLLLEYPNILSVVYILPTSMFSFFIAIVFRNPSIEQNAWLSGKFIVNRRPLISRTIIYIWMCLTYFVSCQDRLKCSVNSRWCYYEFLYWKKNLCTFWGWR